MNCREKLRGVHRSRLPSEVLKGVGKERNERMTIAANRLVFKIDGPIIMVTHRPAITGNFRASVRDFRSGTIA